MTSPVPGVPISTPYGKRGTHWSCDEDAAGRGVHTGADYAAPRGTTVVAARPGRVVYANHGTPFGFHQLEILPGDGTRDFYAHMQSRAVPAGSWVDLGQKIGEIGTEGNVTGAHLHFERHRQAVGAWSCNVVMDPALSINYQEDDMQPADWAKMKLIADKAAEDAVKANNDALVDAIWAKMITVTKPDGAETNKSTKQVIRETWQRVAKKG